MGSSYDINNAPSYEEINITNMIIPTIKKPKGKVRAKYNFIGKSEMELSFRINDEFWLLSNKESKGWCLGLFDHREGYFPKSYVDILEIFDNESNSGSTTPRDLSSNSSINKESNE